ncbi:MAG TPA: amidohydrolase family protein [Candidatus Aquicultor sp.]|jgi:imidazolonepropionase-like amidohydrolase
MFKRRRTLVRADSIFDPAHGYTADRFILVEDGVIQQITPHFDMSRVDTQDIEVVDCTGYTISPPFSDYHLHFFTKDETVLSKIASGLASSGITKVYEAGDIRLSGLEAKNLLGCNISVMASGYAIYKRDGYGGFLGRGVADAAEAEREIGTLISYGVDYIKIINSGIFIPQSGSVSAGEFERGELAVIIDYAHRMGLPVACHANTDVRVRDAVYAGADMIVHGFFATAETLSLMAERGTSLIPTVTALSYLKKAETSPEAVRSIDTSVREHLDMVARAKDMGISVLPGSDAGSAFIPYGTTFLRELGYLAEAEFSVEEILKAATAEPLKEGAPAGFLAVDGYLPQRVFIDGAELA